MSNQKKIVELSELSLLTIAKYSAMNKYDLYDFIASQLEPRNQKALFIEQFLFVRKMFQMLKSKLFKKGVIFTPSTHYPELYNGWYSKDYFSDIQQAVCRNVWLCDLLGRDTGKATPEQIAQIMQIIEDDIGTSRWKNRVSPFAIAVLITKLGAKELCGCSNFPDKTIT